MKRYLPIFLVITVTACSQAAEQKPDEKAEKGKKG